MYQTGSISYMASSASPASGLEYIAQSAVSYSPSFSAVSSPLYGAALFEPVVSSFSYSNLEAPTQTAQYSSSNPVYAAFPTKPEYHFQPESFLKPGKEGIFVGKAEEIREHIQEAFEKLMNKPLPKDLKIVVCDEKEFRKIAPNPSTVGLSINRSQHGLLSEIFVLSGSLGRVMLTLGHEIGHVLTSPQNDAVMEEAKAYAFSFAWMKVIKENNIANLGDAIILENPALNGLHDVAFEWVHNKMRGKEAFEVWREIVGGRADLECSVVP